MPGVCQLFAIIAMSFACVLHFAMSSSAFHPHIFQNLHPFGFSRFSPLSVRSPDHLRAPVAPSQTLFHVRVLNFLGMSRGLRSGLGIAPVDRLSSFVPFGVRLILQRLTGNRKAPLSLQPNTPPKWPKTQQTLLHALGRSITIAWPKTAPHLDSPSSQNL